MIFPRLLEPKLQKELTTKEIVVITGMRQVGKTTLLNKLFNQVQSNNKVLLDLQNPLHRKIFEEEDYSSVWANLLAFNINNKKQSFIFLDEIQNLPVVSRVVKYLYDHWPVKFFLTGSSSFYLKNLFPESLAGRKIIYELFPLTFQEFLVFKGVKRISADGFIKKSALKNKIAYQKLIKFYQEYEEFGGFPRVVLEPDFKRKKRLLEEIFQSYFEIDVKSLADFKNIAKLRDLILILTGRIGSRLDITKLSSEIGVNRQTIYAYLSFLEQTYFISLVSKFTKSVDRRAAGSKKLYFCDSGLANFLGRLSEGQLFEQSVWQNLNPHFKLNYWASRDQEIDFIVNRRIGLEVKQTVVPKHIKRWRRLAKTLGLDDQYLVAKNFTAAKEVIMATDL